MVGRQTGQSRPRQRQRRLVRVELHRRQLRTRLHLVRARVLHELQRLDERSVLGRLRDTVRTDRQVERRRVPSRTNQIAFCSIRAFLAGRQQYTSNFTTQWCRLVRRGARVRLVAAAHEAHESDRQAKQHCPHENEQCEECRRDLYSTCES